MISVDFVFIHHPTIIIISMLQDQTILFVSQARIVLKGTTATLKKGDETMQTGFVQKKIVISTTRMYIFESPHTDTASTEFRIKKEKQLMRLGKDKVRKEFYSVTGTPQKTIQILGKDCKANLVPDEKFKKYLQEKLPIFNTNQMIKNVGLLVDAKAQKTDLIFFPTPEATIRFAKACKALNAWNVYLQACRKNNIPFNIEWAIFLQDYVYKDSCIFAIDPLHYHDGINEELEMNCFCVLVDALLGIHGLEFKFMIKDDYGYQCCDRFLRGITNVNVMRILIFTKCEILDVGLTKILSHSENLSGLTTINLSYNKLTDLCFDIIKELMVTAPYLKFVDLSHNQIGFAFSEPVYQMLKEAKQELVLNFSYNIINDNSIDNIQNNILLPINPPIQEINMSFNKFSKDGQWRLFAMNMEMEPYHTRMMFIIYPVPFHVDIFKNLPYKKWPVQSKQDYFSNLILNGFTSPKASSIGDRSLISLRESEIRKNPSSNNSRREEMELARPKIGIKISRSTASDKQPAKTEELDQITRVKNELVIMVGSKNVPLETFYNQAKEISSYSFSFPTIALQPISAWLGEKMNEALRIRDHESIDLIYESCQMLGVSLTVYKERLERVERRKELLCYRLYNLFNFNMNEMELVPELEQLIKQSLRLCLKGTAIDLLYYIKYLKDQKIKTFIKNQYSPYVELQDRRTESYAKLFQNAIEVREQIPYGLRKITQIDVNLYDYYLYVNYFLLAMISSDDYDKLVILLRQLSSSHPEYSKFINQAFQRINFIVTEFYKSFIYSVFSISYFELKINSCRMVWQYNNIKKSVLYSDLPNFPKKTPITPEKNIKIHNKEDFVKKYNLIKNYDNIKMEVRQRGIMGYKSVYTRYTGKLFQQEVKKLCQIIVKLFEAIHADVMATVYDDIVKLLLDLIQFVRGCTHVRELLEELYVHIICFDINDKKLLLKIVAIMTMYLRPPPAIQNYLIAFLEVNKFDFDYLSLSVEFEKNPINKFIDRDWLPTHKQMKELIKFDGKVNIMIRTTEGKIRFNVCIKESKTVGDLMNEVYNHEVLAEYPDKATFWIYKHNLQTNTEEIILYDDYVGELISNYKQDKEEFIVRRRIYSPFYVINFHKYTDSILNSIYHEVKHFYLLGIAYIVFDDSETSLGAIIAIIDVLEEAIKNSREITFEERDLKLFTEGLREKIAQILPINTRNQRSFKLSSAVAEIKEKIEIQFKNPQNLTIQKLQRRFLDEFRNSHYYCSSNYQAYLYEENQKCLVSINTQYISIETITDQKNIFYQSLLSLCPDENFLNIYYYDKQKLETVEIVLEIKARISLAIVMDVLSYCVMRLYTSNMYIYLQRQLHQTLFKYDYPLSAFDPDKQQRGEEAIMASLKHRRGQSNASRKEAIANLNHIVGRLRTMELGIYKETDFIFQQEMKFSKWELNREVFPFRSERLLPKSDLVRKGESRDPDESNYEGSITNNLKDRDEDLEGLNTPRLEDEEMFRIPENQIQEIESPLMKHKPKEEEKKEIEIEEFNLQRTGNEEIGNKVPAQQKKAETPKIEIPKLQLPKRKQETPKFVISPKPQVVETQKQPIPSPPLVTVPQKQVQPPKVEIPQPKVEVPKQTIEIPKQVEIPVLPVAQPIIPEPIHVPTTTVPTSSLKPPPPTQQPVVEPKPQEPQIPNVVKPRNSNKLYDRASRRRQ